MIDHPQKLHPVEWMPKMTKTKTKTEITAQIPETLGQYLVFALRMGDPTQ